MKYRVMFGAIALLVGTLPSGCVRAGGTAHADGSRFSVVSSFSHGLAGNPAGAVENYAAALAVSDRDPDHWGGAYIDGDTLVVKYVDQSKETADLTLSAAGAVGRFSSRPGLISLAQFRQAKDLLHDFGAGKLGIVSVSPNYMTGRLDIGSSYEDAGPLLELLGKILPPGMGADIKPGEQGGSPTAASRFYDTISYNGGNAIALSNSSGAVGCSTGFNLTGSSDGYAYAVTASHCYVQRQNGTAPFPAVNIHRTSGSISGMGTVWTVSGGPDGTISGRNGDLVMVALVGRPVPG